MSFEAKGILCYILSLPDDWILHTTKLMSDFNIGRHLLNRCFAEIEEAGYMAKLGIVKGKGGRFEGYSYMFYDTSIKEQPYADFPHAVQPHTEKQHLQRTNNNKELINTTNTPLSPKGEEEVFEEIGLSIEEWIQSYLNINRKFGVQRTIEDINKSYLARKLNKWRKLGLDNTKPLKALYNILGDRWEREHKYPSAAGLKKLFDMDNVARWSNRIDAKC